MISEVSPTQAQMKQVMKVWGYCGENMVVDLMDFVFSFGDFY